jgi:dTDP-glucose pyrophosphorylase
MSLSKAVILAAGRGTRMQRDTPGAQLDDAQRAAAERGSKGLMPIHGRAFLDYVISAVADAGVTDVCLVVGPGAHPVRAHYEDMPTTRVRLSMAVQQEPRGAAHALLAAAQFAAGDDVLVLNADNYYPPESIAALRDMETSALAGFRRAVLVAQGNIPRERLAAYAIVRADARGFLTDIIEKPGPAEIERTEGAADRWISMTCWRFRAPIFAACRAIAPSPRGEYELPDAVLYALRTLHEPFRVVPVDVPVLDLTSREDIASVTRWLHGRKVRL